jgi:hypothetical protein
MAKTDGLGWLYKTYLLVRELVGMRDGELKDEDIKKIICKLDAFDRELASKPPDYKTTPEDLQKWEDTLKEIDDKCGHRQDGVYRKTQEGLKEVRKARKAGSRARGA